MTRQLPVRPNAEHLRKQAKRLLAEASAGDPVAQLRLQAIGKAIDPKLTDAQLALAREYGFPSWEKMLAHVAAKRELDPMEALASAIRSKDAGLVRDVLARHPEIVARLDQPMPGGSFGATPLLAAAQQRAIVEVLLEAGANIDQKSHWWAGGFGVLDDDRADVDFLVARGATVDAYAASRHGMVDRLVALLNADPSRVNQRGGDGQTPLHVARTVEIARILLDRGADVDARDIDHESTPAQYLVRSRPEVARYLVSRGASTDILLAAALGDLEAVRRHLDAEPESIRTTMSELNFPKRDPRAGGHVYTWTLGLNKSPHALAQQGGHHEVLALLLQRTPPSLRLALAGELGDEAQFRKLLAQDPTLPARLTDDEKLRLVSAAESNDTRAVAMMLEAGWSPNVSTHGTPLHWAAWHGNSTMARALIAAGGSLTAIDSDHGGTPLGWAFHGSLYGWHRATGDYAAVVDALLEAGAEPPTPDTVMASEAAVAGLRQWLDRRRAGPASSARGPTDARPR